jgi:hypothetical protein
MKILENKKIAIWKYEIYNGTIFLYRKHKNIALVK